LPAPCCSLRKPSCRWASRLTRTERISLPALSEDFADTTETYKAAQRWLGGTPATRELKVYGAATADATITATMNKGRNKLWWFWTFWTAPIYADKAKARLIAQWCEDNSSFNMNNQTGASAAEIRDPADTDDIASS
jgi:hypothetical protein